MWLPCLCHAQSEHLPAKTEKPLDGAAQDRKTPCPAPSAHLPPKTEKQLDSAAQDRKPLGTNLLTKQQTTAIAQPFWSTLYQGFSDDANRFEHLYSELGQALIAPPIWRWILLSLAILAVLGLSIKLKHFLLRLITARVSIDRLRRSLYVLTSVVLGTLAPGIIAQLIYVGLDWQEQLPPEIRTLLTGLVNITYFGGFIASLGAALLSTAQPAWQLFNIPNPVAQRLRNLPLTLGVITVLVWFIEHLGLAFAASSKTALALKSLATLLLVITLTLSLQRLKTALQTLPIHARWTMISLGIVRLILLVALASTLIGYSDLGNLIVQQTVWALVVLCTAYLLCVLVDTFFTAILDSPHNQTSADPSSAPPLRKPTFVLLSGVIRLFIILIAAMLLFSEFGGDPSTFLYGNERLRQGLTIGAVHIQPTALVQAALVFAAGLFAVQFLKRWLAQRYLPTTTLDPAMQISTTKLIGYTAIVIVTGLTLSALGIGLSQLTWVASALSVGIGFGLQAVVQNFVSGLILLTERPIKVGDWVSLGGVEGDILSINARATEIQMKDYSTVIVPNSLFITTIVRNVTRSDPLGRVKIKLALPLNANSALAQKAINGAFSAHADILHDPSPKVTLESVDSNGLLFNAIGYVTSPRQAYAVRGALLLDILTRLANAGISLENPPTVLVNAQPNAASRLDP
jgi:small-conductance mechanosensitive channel